MNRTPLALRPVAFVRSVKKLEGIDVVPTKAQSPAALQRNGAHNHMPPHVDLLITKKELAKRLGVCIPTVTAYVRKHIIPGVVAGTRRYSWIAVEETLKLPRASPGRPTAVEAAELAFDEDVMRHG